MGRSVARQLIESHLVAGRPEPGSEIGLSVDQTLTQDATGTTVMLELEAMGLDRVRTEVSAALTGTITDPRRLPDLFGIDCPAPALPERFRVNTSMLVPPLPAGQARREPLVKGPNIVSLPGFDPLPEPLEATVALKCGDDISTDEIMPAGSRVLPLRSNIPAIAEFAFTAGETNCPAARYAPTTSPRATSLSWAPRAAAR